MLNFGFLAPENILYPIGRLKVARGDEGVLGAQFSIGGEGGGMLPDRLMGEQGTFCAAQGSPQRWLVFLQHRPCLLSVPTSAARKGAGRWREKAKPPFSHMPQNNPGCGAESPLGYPLCGTVLLGVMWP